MEISEKVFIQNVCLKNTKSIANFDAKLGHLNIHHKEQVQHLMTDYPSISLDVPKKTNAA